jgi:hypothetical protein
MHFNRENVFLIVKSKKKTTQTDFLYTFEKTRLTYSIL